LIRHGIRDPIARVVVTMVAIDDGRESTAQEKGGSMVLKVYGFAKVNAGARGKTRDLRVLWGLEEMQLPFELAGMDHPAHDLNTDAYRQLSPFEQIPAIDDDGLKLSESAAILVYLAKKSGRLIPGDLAGESQVVRWCFAAMNSLEMPLMSIQMLGWFQDDGAAKYREFLLGWARRHLGNLERWFEGRDYIATDSFTVADILTAHVLSVVREPGLIESYPRVAGYRDRCLARPAWKRTMESYCARVEAG
jgi:glutathione S-transferase